MNLTPPRAEGAPLPRALHLSIEYGQPAARGRDVPRELASVDSIWRTGADLATTLSTDVDLDVGTLHVPKGTYSLYTVRTASGYQLIVNRQLGELHGEYDRSQDVGRLPLTARTRAETQESLHIALRSADDRTARGTLLIAWGKLELTTPFVVR